MFLSDVSIRRPVFTAMMSLCLIVLGTMGLSRLGTDLYPEVNFPFVTVNVPYRGAGPAEIETQVIKPIEDAVAGISGVDKIHSWSQENLGTVVVAFTLDSDLDTSVQEVRDKVALVTGKLPRDADAPVISRADLSATPILTYAVSADLPSHTLRRLIDDRVRPALAQVEGVAEVRITGGDVREIQVNLDLDKARAAGVAPAEIAQRIGAENLNLPVGRLLLGPTEMTVRALGEFESVEELRALPVARSRTGAQVRLDEIATVTDGVAERRTTARLNGRDAIVMEVVKQPGTNTVKVSDAAGKRLAELGPSLGNNFQATLLIEQSELIRENAKEVWIALVFGGAMAVLIILAFLLDLRGTFISSLALPTSVMATFLVMHVLGYTLNQFTLLALSLAIGLLIDDAVVVREAITHRLEQGEDPMSAAANGTKDVGLAVLATTFSLVAVFLPMAFMSGIVGQFFKEFGVTICVAVLFSMFISFTLDPALSARLAKARRPGEERKENAVARSIRRVLDGSERFYERILIWVLANKWKTAGISVVLLASSCGAAAGLGTDFIPPSDRSKFIVDLRLPDAVSLAETEARTAQAEALLKRIPEVVDIYSIAGLNGNVDKARLRVLTLPKAERKRGIEDLKTEARGLLSELVSTQVTLGDGPNIEGLGDWYPIIMRVTGPDLVKVNEEAQRLTQMLQALPGTSDVRVELSSPKPELQVKIDRARANDVDLSAASLATQLRLAIGGEVAAKLREGKDETDILVRLQEQDRATPEKVRQMQLYTPHGLMPVTDLAQVSMRKGPSVIEHENRERQVAINSQLSKGAALGDVAVQIRQYLAEHPLPAGYALIYDGDIKTLDEQGAAFGTALGLSFIFIFMVLASQFESLKHPFTIMVSLPLALVGALLGLLVTGNHLSLGAMIGIILLMGLVTKNAILLVDGALQNLHAGDSVDMALLKAGPRRLRPILMTSAAMAIAMVPTAVGKGLGSEFRAPMAISVIGGVIASTFLTLLVVPVVFAGIERLGFRRKKAPSAPAGQVHTAPAMEASKDQAA
jgi:hydrophobic/amphiphilic exporter-1 (mainly G- bacteria), HAE1 family